MTTDLNTLNQPVNQPVGDIVRRMLKFDAATLHEAYERRGALAPSIKPVDPAMVCCGPAFTVACLPGDNLMLQVALSKAPAGSVVVMSNDGCADYGVFGDLLANACSQKGLAGFVTDAAVRDARLLRKIGFPVFSAGLSIRGTEKQAIGPLNVPVMIGGQRVHPGDLVFGDEDGVLVVPFADCERVLATADAMVATEQKKIAQYQEGRTIIEVNGLTPLLQKKGWTEPL